MARLGLGARFLKRFIETTRLAVVLSERLGFLTVSDGEEGLSIVPRGTGYFTGL